MSVTTAMKKVVEEITHQGNILAIVVRDSYDHEGITFFTKPDFSQQLAHMHHPKGKVIEPHIHNPVVRKVEYTEEVLVVKQGVVRVDFYNPDQTYLESRILRTGDVILLIAGGHGFEVIEDLIMFEIKQGPYTQKRDKTKFSRPQQIELKVID